jgi:hypothetical protein
LGIPPKRWVWQVAGRHESARVVEVAAALARDDPAPARERRTRGACAAASAAAFPMSRARVLRARCPGAHRAACEDAGVVMEVIWDVLVFLALVAVGLVVLNLLARRR